MHGNCRRRRGEKDGEGARIGAGIGADSAGWREMDSRVGEKYNEDAGRILLLRGKVVMAREGGDGGGSARARDLGR
jgi:hypothetical protein